jgi:hypothetical protein
LDQDWSLHWVEVDCWGGLDWGVKVDYFYDHNEFVVEDCLLMGDYCLGYYYECENCLNYYPFWGRYWGENMNESSGNYANQSEAARTTGYATNNRPVGVENSIWWIVFVCFFLKLGGNYGTKWINWVNVGI